jgi:hypothetical protein
LTAQRILKKRSISIRIGEVCAYRKDSCLREELRMGSIVPVSIDEQIARIGLQESVGIKLIGRAIAVKLEGAENGRDAQLLARRNI